MDARDIDLCGSKSRGEDVRVGQGIFTPLNRSRPDQSAAKEICIEVGPGDGRVPCGKVFPGKDIDTAAVDAGYAGDFTVKGRKLSAAAVGGDRLGADICSAVDGCDTRGTAHGKTAGQRQYAQFVVETRLVERRIQTGRAAT